ncbi:hypothetical protein EDD15DRAFT_2322708 [Pisolithus albus]|nr:hypothetical protein EDD15DRAFT_2322708 [Pisolithus albus]
MRSVMGMINDDSTTPAAVSGLTQKDALQASLLLREYVKDIDDPFACKLELMLGSFGQRTRVLDTSIPTLENY